MQQSFLQRLNKIKLDLSAKSTTVKVIVTILLMVLVNILKLLLKDYISSSTPFLLYFGLVLICGRYIGFWYAIFACLVCGVVAYVFFIYPVDGFKLQQLIAIIIYVLECIFIAYLTNEFKKALVAVEESEANFKALIENSADGIAKISASGEILFLSPSFQRIVGFTATEFQANRLRIFPNEKEREIVAKEFLNILKEPGKSVTVVHQYLTKENKLSWLEATFTNHLNLPGVNAVIANFRDVSDRVEADLKRNDFLGILSHEIKNPVSAIAMCSELMEISLDTDDKELMKVLTGKIQNQTRKVLKLLNEFLTLSAFEASLLHLQYEKISVKDLYDNCLLSFKATYKNEIILKGAGDIVFYADTFRIEQVLINLLTNAAKYSPENTSIIIEYVITDGYLKFSVTDSGVGIPKDKFHLLFDKFQRVRATSTVNGFGLGLYICSEIVKAHEGKIGVESEEGKGSVFWFAVPYKPGTIAD